MKKQGIIIIIFQFLLIKYVKSSIISKSELSTCYKSSNTTDCKSKILISLTLENSQKKDAEELHFSIDSLNVSNSKEVLTPDPPIKITFSKSNVNVLYKLSYLSHFNSKVFETVIDSTWPFCSEGLFKDEQLFKDSTCKFKKDKDNKIIPDSQGFCCSCPKITLLTGVKSETTRGSCGMFSSSETAHCLNFSDNFFASFEIELYDYEYDIDMYLNGNKRITISSTSRVSNIENGKIIAKLIGDFLPEKSPPQLIGKILLLPDKDSFYNQSNLYELGVGNAWMVVPRDMFSLDGSACNKIGTSYKAFQYQSNKCSVIKGSCLNNQIEDLLKEDEINLKSNKTAKYLLKSFGDFTESINKNGTIHLKMAYTDVFTTQVSLEIDASDFKFYTNLGNLKLNYYKINDFYSFNEDGKLEMEVENISNYSSNFEVSVICDKTIDKIDAKLISLKEREIMNVNFTISSNNKNETNNICTIIFKNSVGDIILQQEIRFKTFATKQEYSTYNNSEIYNYTDTTKNDEAIEELEVQKCELLCPEAYNLPCILINGCWNNYYKVILFYGGILIILVIIFIKIKPYLCCFKKKEKNNDNNIVIKVDNNNDNDDKNNKYNVTKNNKKVKKYKKDKIKIEESEIYLNTPEFNKYVYTDSKIENTITESNGTVKRNSKKSSITIIDYKLFNKQFNCNLSKNIAIKLNNNEKDYKTVIFFNKLTNNNFVNINEIISKFKKYEFIKIV